MDMDGCKYGDLQMDLLKRILSAAHFGELTPTLSLSSSCAVQNKPIYYDGF